MGFSRQIHLNRTVALVVSVALLLGGVLGTTLMSLFVHTPSLHNTFLPWEEESCDLTVRKELVHPFGDSYVVPENLVFDFGVNLSPSYGGKTLETSRGTVECDAEGRFSVQLRPGEALQIFDLTPGTVAAVTETPKAGFTVREGNAQELELTDGNNQMLFTNVYQPEPVAPVNVTVEGIKILEGRQWQEGDAFTFLLEYKRSGDDSQWQTLGTATVTYELIEVTDPETGEVTKIPKPDFDRFSFTQLVQELPYTAAGEYAFRASEVDGTIPGITYDRVVSYFDILVGDADMDGALEIREVTGYQNAAVTYDPEENIHRIALTVNNRYAPAGSAAAKILIQKTVQSNSGQDRSLAGYAFALYDTEGNLLLTSEETSAAGEAVMELTYDATDAGKTFRYILKEVHSGETLGAMTYDDREYPLCVSVVDNLDGTISAFIYDGETPESPTDEPPEEETPGETAPVETEPVETVPEETVPETSEPQEPTADTQPEDEQEQPEPETDIPADATDIYEAAFENRYDPVNTQVTFTGTKVLEGRDLRDGEFSFLLYATGDSFAIAEGMEPVQTAVNARDGSFAFTPVSYSQVGTYRYVVKESMEPALNGVNYDPCVYHITVTVTDDNGTLVARTLITDALGNEEPIAFRNTYVPEPTGISVKGVKELSGMALREGMFRFLLYRGDEEYTPQGEPIATATNDASGNFRFERLVYDTVGVFHYVAKEDTSSAIAGMTYDERTYGIRVTVWDDGTGELKAMVTYTLVGGQTVDGIRFVNSYTEPEVPTEPTDPTQPDPTDPTDPDPTVPTDPDPTDPDPTEPTDPDPTVPTDPEPTVPTDPAPSDPVAPTGPGDPVVPPTGDNAPVGWYLAMCAVSFTGLLMLLVLLLTKKRPEDDEAE